MLEQRWFALADRLARSVCRRHGLRREAEEEFLSFVRVRLAERGEPILAAHDGKSSVETYLLVVLERMRQDWQRAEWGLWRPSREAARLGPLAVELDRLVHRDGVPFSQAAEELHARFGDRAKDEELERIAARLPDRVPRRRVSDDVLENRPSGGDSAASLEEREREEVAGRAVPALREAIRGLDTMDRVVLVLVFREGLSVRAAARALGHEHKRIGRRLERVLEKLRAALREEGVDRHGLLLLLEGSPGEEAWLGGAVEPRWDRRPPRPSPGEGAEP